MNFLGTINEKSNKFKNRIMWDKKSLGYTCKKKKSDYFLLNLPILFLLELYIWDL